MDWTEAVKEHNKAPALMNLEDLENICAKLETTKDIELMVKALLEKGQREHQHFKSQLANWITKTECN